MDKIRVIHDTFGGTLTIWLDDPKKEVVCEETADEVVLMKDAAGRVIGMEFLHYRPTSPKGQLAIEAMVLPES